MPKLLRICLISVLALVYNKLSNAIYCRCGPTRSPRADFRATLQHLSASANQPHTYLATQHPHPHGRTRSRQSCVDSPTMLLRISRKTTVAPGFFPFTDDAGEPRCSGSRKYPEVVARKFAHQARRRDASTSDGNGKCALPIDGSRCRVCTGRAANSLCANESVGQTAGCGADTGTGA